MKKKEPKVKHYCIECVHARDFHELSLAGVFICCKCDYSPYSKILKHDYCEHFKKK